MAGAPEVAKGSTAGWVILAVTTVAAVMMTVTLLACAVPARRAFGVHPADALRAD
jgi:ABC-type lipoprotein release transport system permease subunit